MTRAIEVVNGLDDRTTVRFLEFFGQKLFQSVQGQDVRSLVSLEFGRSATYLELTEFGNRSRSSQLPISRSTALARAILLHFASQPEIAAMLLESWAGYRDDTLGSEATLSVGFAEGLVTLMAADGVALPGKYGQITMRAGDIDLVEALASATLEEGEERNLSPVEFTSVHPTEVLPNQWYSMLAYAHLPEARDEVNEDARRRLADNQSTRSARAHGNYYLKKGAELTIVPEMTGFRFNPEIQRLSWLEDWHCAPFRMQADPNAQGFSEDLAVNGRVAFYVGPVLLAEVKMWAAILSVGAHIPETVEPPTESSSASMYQAVFVSYSHKDSNIVNRLEAAYESLGLEYLRDVKVLRSGQRWNPALLEKIEEADLFQLCWSNNASMSKYVEQEWRHALGLGRESFIRPTFWEEPMPVPPEQLGKLHFSRYVLT